MMSAKQSYKLFTSPKCPFCHRVAIVAREKKIAYESEIIPLDSMPEWYKQLNPAETVPFLQISGKTPVFESNNIALFFDNLESTVGSLMGHSAFQRYRIEFFMSQTSDFISACFRMLRDPFNEAKRQEVEAKVVHLDNVVAENQERGGPFYCDETFSMAEAMILPFFLCFRPTLSYYCGIDLFRKAPHLKRMWAAGRERPSVKETGGTPHEWIMWALHKIPKDFPFSQANGGTVLFTNKYCALCDRVRLACKLTRAAPFCVEIDTDKPPAWYKLLNPSGSVPLLLTQNGEYVREAQLIVQFLDSLMAMERSGSSRALLVPRGDAAKEYAVNYFVQTVENFLSSQCQLLCKPESAEAKEELVWAVNEIQKQMSAKPFGDGPLFGGVAMNAGDIALLPLLIRQKAVTPTLTSGYNVFAEFPFLEAFLEAGLATEEVKHVCLRPDEYLSIIKAQIPKICAQCNN